ncbi:MAG: prepilin-type N-terminal cleavage/methylation domain-containing protein [Lentisphaeria bacterium]|nr:MAG: prepilin-type N-terminal cleavage/methylation domain-containing protein [Lentisphaeria bacterium]
MLHLFRSSQSSIAFAEESSLRRQRRRSFTLIELLIVIAIIAILAGMLLPALQKARQSAKKTECMSRQKQVMLAQIAYADDNQGIMPVSVPYGTTYETWFTLLTRAYSISNCLPTNGNGYLSPPGRSQAVRWCRRTRRRIRPGMFSVFTNRTMWNLSSPSSATTTTT